MNKNAMYILRRIWYWELSLYWSCMQLQCSCSVFRPNASALTRGGGGLHNVQLPQRAGVIVARSNAGALFFPSRANTQARLLCLCTHNKRNKKVDRSTLTPAIPPQCITCKITQPCSSTKRKPLSHWVHADWVASRLFLSFIDEHTHPTDFRTDLL